MSCEGRHYRDVPCLYPIFIPDFSDGGGTDPLDLGVRYGKNVLHERLMKVFRPVRLVRQRTPLHRFC